MAELRRNAWIKNISQKCFFLAIELIAYILYTRICFDFHWLCRFLFYCWIFHMDVYGHFNGNFLYLLFIMIFWLFCWGSCLCCLSFRQNFSARVSLTLLTFPDIWRVWLSYAILLASVPLNFFHSFSYRFLLALVSIFYRYKLLSNFYLYHLQPLATLPVSRGVPHTIPMAWRRANPFISFTLFSTHTWLLVDWQHLRFDHCIWARLCGPSENLLCSVFRCRTPIDKKQLNPIHRPGTSWKTGDNTVDVRNAGWLVDEWFGCAKIITFCFFVFVFFCV